MLDEDEYRRVISQNGGFKPVCPGHPKVQQDQVRPDGVGDEDSVFETSSVYCPEFAVGFAVDDVFESYSDNILVIDNEYELSHVFYR